MTSLLTRTQATGQPELPEVTTAAPKPEVKPARLVSLDAYRGFIMLAMASGGLAIPGVVKTLADKGQDTPLWRFLAFHTDHVPWIGCSFWDLIQPSFMFMVGVAIPFSFASRRARGDSEGKILFHAIWRALLLVLLAVFLSSPLRVVIDITMIGGVVGPTAAFLHEPPLTTNWIFVNVLAQIGLGYVFVFLLRGWGLRVQLGAVAALFIGYTLLFGLYPLPPADFNYASVKSLPEQLGTTGWFAHWNKNTNAAAAFDVWFLNLFPRPVPFAYNDGGYQTLNFVPSMITMILGLMAGEMLRGPRSRLSKLGLLVAAGLGCLALGYVAGMFVCPIVKRIWTPSWAVYSAGWTFLLLAGFYLLIDLAGWRRWAFVFVVVGMNSIAMYCMAQLMKGWVRGRLQMHLNPAWFEGIYGPIISSAAVLLVLWLVCLWMYRRKLFLRI